MENIEKENDKQGELQNLLDDLRKSIENLSVADKSKNSEAMEATETIPSKNVADSINEGMSEIKDNEVGSLIEISELENRVGNRQSPEVTIDEVAEEALVEEEEEPIPEEKLASTNQAKRATGLKAKGMLGAALTGRKPRPPAPIKRSFTEQELIDLRTAFDLLDRDRDGRVTASELQFMLKKLGIQVRDELIDDLLKEASQTGNGLIDEAEFLTWVGRIQSIQNDAEPASSQQEEDDDLTQDLIAAFRVFDRDGNGFITRDELQTAMDMIGEHLTETQLNELLSIADLDKDGRINYEEFKIWFKSYLE